MARPPSANSILKKEKQKFEPKSPIASDMYLPNHSGITDHPEFQAHTHKLDTIENPDGDTTFTFNANKHLHMRWTGDFTGDDGGLEIEAFGGFTGDLVHIHQHTGNPGAVDLVHLEADDADVIPLHIVSGGGNVIIEGADVGIGTTSPGAPLHIKGSGVVGPLVESTAANESKFGFQNTQSTWFCGNNNSGNYFIRANVTDTIEIDKANGNWDFKSNQIKSLADPTLNQDAATKKYVDDNLPSGTMFVSITVEDPADDEDITICRFNEAVTITKVVGVIKGATSVTIDPEHGTDRTSGNDLFTNPEVISSTTTGNVETGFTDATIPADSFLWLTTTALNGTPTELNLTFFYTTD